MIAKADMMGVLVEACPSFAPHWEAFQDEWREEADPPLYLSLSDFARHLIGMSERGEATGLSAAFAAVELLHREGDPYVREAATVGLLEALQNRNLHTNGTSPDLIRPYLGPVSARGWDELNRFWEGGERLTDK
jgi:hypothetical protein